MAARIRVSFQGHVCGPINYPDDVISGCSAVRRIRLQVWSARSTNWQVVAGVYVTRRGQLTAGATYRLVDRGTAVDRQGV